MAQRTADRTGLLFLQHIRQNPCLLIQKGSTHFPVGCFFFLHIRCRLLIQLLGSLKLCAQLPVSRKLQAEGIQFCPLPLCLLLFPHQALSLFSGACIFFLLFLQFTQAACLLLLLIENFLLSACRLPQLPIQPPKLCLKLFQLLIGRKLCLKLCGFRLKPFLLRLSFLLFFSFRFRLCKPLFTGRPLFLCPL